MNVHDLYINYSPVGDTISFLTCVTLLWVIKRVLFFAHDSKFLFLKVAVHYILIGTALNVGFYFYIQSDEPVTWVVFALRSLYHIAFMNCLYLFVVYLKSMLAVHGKEIVAFTYFTRFFFVAMLILDVLSPFTRLGFYKVGDLWYDPIVSPYNAFYVYAVLLLVMMPLFYPNRMIRTVRLCIFFTEIIVAVIMIKGGIENTNTLTSFTYVLPVLVVMILLHSRPFDDVTGALSADSFESFINQSVKRSTSFDYMILKLDLNVIGTLTQELGKVLNSFWHDSFKDALLFNVEHDMYVLAIPRIAKNGNTEEKVKILMGQDFQAHYIKYQIPYKVLGLLDIDFIRSDSDIMTMINYLLITMKENEVIITDDKLREQLKLLLVVKENLVDIEKKLDLDDPRVLAYCQPIKNMKTGRFDTGEALMRLMLPDKGLIMPFIFIPLAEHYGYIHALTLIMLNKVCKEIKKLESEGYVFDRISVNISASEIRNESFCAEILDIIKKNEIDASRIGIEITETQNESDLKIVKDRMVVFKEHNMTLYLDDVGTGYSNIDRIVKYDVDVVKFDRFFLLEAENNPKVALMMKHLSQAFKDLNYTLLYEGVETEENEALCLKCGAEYIQGFKYSKPLPVDEMRTFLIKNK